MELDSILGTNEVRCKQIAYQIIEEARKEGKSPVEGFQALIDVHAAVKSEPGDGTIRARYLERAWNEIGAWQA